MATLTSRQANSIGQHEHLDRQIVGGSGNPTNLQVVVDVSAAELLLMGLDDVTDAPSGSIALIPAPGPGKAIVINRVTTIAYFGTQPYGTDGNQLLVGTNTGYSLNAAVPQNWYSLVYINTANPDGFQLSYAENLPVMLFMDPD